MSHYDFFQNRECEYFPCHPGADPETFSCLFCYCPLYVNTFPAIRGLTRKLSAACSATARCIALGNSAAAASAIRKTGSRTAPTACALTGRKITMQSATK